MNPRRALYLLPIIAACALILFAGIFPALAQGGSDSEQFDNGHIVSGEFLKFYRSVPNPERIFGLPITVVFKDPLGTGKEIQYFERVRMERNLSLPAGEQVSLANLGEFAYDQAHPGIVAPLQPNDPKCRIFSNGKLVCYAFLDFYNRYGQKLIGLPETNVLVTEEGRLVQYFEHLRMEWRGELPAGQRVVVTALGQVDFDKRIGKQSYRSPSRRDIPKLIIPSVRAFAGQPLIVNGEKQQVFVIIRDQFGEPITDASVKVTFYYPEDGKQGWAISGLKIDENGIAIADYMVKDISPNDVVRVEVEAYVNDEELTASTWFRVWW